MKKKFRIPSNLISAAIAALSLIYSGCKQNPDPPALSTVEVTEITLSTAKAGGNISSDGGADISSKGVCWGTASMPSVSGPHSSDGNGAEAFTSNITGLSASTKYYVRAYATNEAGTAYGNEVSFTTLAQLVATISTIEASAITSVSAVSGGNITSDGGSSVTARGVCWSTTANPTISNSKSSDGSGTGNFASDITGLQPGTTYHIRAYATNSIGTSYGNDISFTTDPVIPTVTTTNISSVTRTSAVSGGNVTSSGGANVTAKGVCWSTSVNPVISGSHTSDGAGTGSFTSNISGLNPNTTYYYRAYATNSVGTAYGTENHFTTSPASVATVVTTAASSITLNTAISGGDVTNENGAPVTERGVCWNTTGNPTTSSSKLSNGTGTGTFTINLSGLSAGTVYYFKAYAINSAGTAYGSQMTLSTSMADIDGNIYRTVLIGSQLWFAENLRTETYSNNHAIPYVEDKTTWSNLSTDAFCWFNDDPVTYKNTYGGLYNWFAVETGNLCPTGWHVPSDQEFKTMEMSLGMTQAEADRYSILNRGTDQGTQIKSTTGWYNGGNGTNSSGFNGLPGGYRYGQDGEYYDFGKLSYWWSSTEFEYDSSKGTYRRADYSITGIMREGTSKKGGKYIRCLKN